MTSFQLGIDTSDHLIVRIVGRPDEHDDWLDAAITVRAGIFSAEIPMNVATCDFPPFRHQLESLYRTLNGKAVFWTAEQQLGITCIGNDIGAVLVEGFVKDRVSDGNELRFQFAIDQTFLRESIDGLQRIEAMFPNIVHPPFSQ